jgi:hypothetical protein
LETLNASANNPRKPNPVQANIYIDAPTFTANSNGIRCLYYLAARLAKEGVTISFVPRLITEFRKKLPAEFCQISVTPSWSLRAPGILICCESVPSKTIAQARKRGIRILWWFLAPYGLLERPKSAPKTGDMILPFSSFILPEKARFSFFQPPVDSHWEKAFRTYRPNSEHKSRRIAIYCGKGRLKALPDTILSFLYNTEIVAITRSSPSCRSELFDLLSSVDGLVTFDELSQIMLECLTLGVPVLSANPLFPVESFDLFPAPLTRLLTKDWSRFIELVEQRRRGLIKPIPFTAVFSENDNTVSHIIRLISGNVGEDKFCDQSTLPKMKAFGRKLRSTRALYPHYSGQSAGSFLFRLYIASLRLEPFRHRVFCKIVSVVDEVGSALFKIGSGMLFYTVATRIQRSAKARKISTLARKTLK